MKAHVIRIHLKQIISMLIKGSAVIVLQSKWKEFLVWYLNQSSLVSQQTMLKE